MCYRDMPKTAKNQYWKSSARNKLFARKEPKNMIEENIKNVRKLNNTNLLNKLQFNSDLKGNNKNRNKANLTKSRVERGENYIIFKRQSKRKRFNETRRYVKGNRRALS